VVVVVRIFTWVEVI